MFNPQKAYFSREWMRRWAERLNAQPAGWTRASSKVAHRGPQARLNARFLAQFHAPRSA